MESNKLLFALGISVLVFLQSCNLTSTHNKQTIAKTNNQQQASLKSTPQTPPEPKVEFEQAKSDKLTNTAKFLAGMEVDSNSNLAVLQKKSNWQNHRRFFENAWSKLETQHLAKLRQWSQQELKQINTAFLPVFYPFSGPDFLYTYSLFPQAKEYVFMGLEPVMNVPDLVTLSENQRDLKLQEIRSSLQDILQFSFFITKEMKVDLQKQGVLPILYVFMARTQNSILDVQDVGIDKDAKIQQFQKGMIPGVKIIFVPKGESQPRNLYYFSTDASNSGLKQRPEFSQFISQLDLRVTYLKAASYLMYGEDFSDIRTLILAKTTYLLQDDSGIPLKFFDRSRWNLKFYGSYIRPIPVFNHDYQPELRQIYVTDKTIKPLNFGIGYKFGVNESNLMLAETKKLSATKP
ncbi:hypothetical protein [Brasilonema sp. UFV-L1]|uniref:hypothetical protein n=1 Tax=Brasilonema sp. UFV-L1 TaxID=2234130 RepID=UPI00145F9F81|nr:hypothetical protein [Brasilonema sp. UFV-L1]NMG07541.1 hypothetical protein [Brasilonema sp. UFV-L1]